MNKDNNATTFSSLDPSQKDAFNSIVNSDTNLQIVLGPPGTGKSQVVVSLLERLAAKDKKVLFVSQNTEALKVIERMIKRTEKTIGYPSDKKYLSLTDFCLMLHNPTHRYLKYLREQYTRLDSKQLPTAARIDAPEEIQYALEYTNLDHEINYRIGGETIGFDELVSYHIRYVTHAMAPEPLRTFDQVNVRAIFKALDEYTYQNYFAEFNKPRRELVLLSTDNPDLSLPDVRNELRDIKEAVHGSWTEQFALKEEMSVQAYLSTLKEYISARQLLDIYKITTENKDLNELSGSLGVFIASNEATASKIAALDSEKTSLLQKFDNPIEGISHDTPKVSLNTETLAIAEKNIDEIVDDLKRLIALIQASLKQYPDIIHVGLRDIWLGLAKDTARLYTATFGADNNRIIALKSADIIRLNNDLNEYDQQNGVKRMLSGIPASFKELLGFENAKELEVYRDHYRNELAVLANIIVINDETIESLIAVSQQDTKIASGRLGITPASALKELEKPLANLHELIGLLKKYKIEDANFDTTKTQIRNISANVTAVRTSIGHAANKKQYLSTNIAQFIELFNGTVDIELNKFNRETALRRQRELQIESHRQNAPYLVGTTELSDYIAKASEIREYLTHKISSLTVLTTRVSLPDTNAAIEGDIDTIENAIQRAAISNHFSEFFFALREGQTLSDWLKSITTLETYNNDAEVVDFVEHNKTISSIRNAFGIDNKKYLDEILANDVTFYEFAARIISAVINECFGRAQMGHKKHVSTKNIIEAYEKFLKAKKVQSYSLNLQYMHSRSQSATRELSKQSVLQTGGKSTMDKFRHNTKLILDAFPIVCATPRDVARFIAADKAIFDYVIFDEASQLLPGQAIPSMYRAEKAVIIGDPHQMPPNLNATFGSAEQSEDEFEDLGESILDLALKQPQQKHHLKVHYRSRYNKLFEPSREAIYAEDGIEPIFEAELANGAPIDIIDDLGEGLDDSGYDKNFHKIGAALEQYIDKNSDADFCVLFTTVTVLSQFKNFLAEVGDRKFSKISKLYGEDKILLSTVTNCQGIEGVNTIIYMHHYARPGSMWFFNESAGAYKRLNVSITRQREGLTLLLADPRSHWLAACEDKLNRNDVGQNTQKSAQLMKSLLTNAGEQADMTYLDRKLGQNASWFDSPLTEQLFHKLNEHYKEKLGSDIKLYSEVGWNLLIPTGEGINANNRNVGFRIDIGVFSVSKKKFILGIEMDGAMYHSGYDKEHSDYTRQKVLENKGWELYRIWSTNWLNDEQREFGRLVESIDSRV